MLMCKVIGELIVPVVLCDYCKQRIGRAAESIVIIPIDKPILIVHKTCDLDKRDKDDEYEEEWMDVGQLIYCLVKSLDIDLEISECIADINV